MKRNNSSFSSKKIGNKLWDIIMKSIAAHAPNQFLPLIKEIFFQEYAQDASIDFLSTEYPVSKKARKQGLSTIFADIVMQVSKSGLYHFEWQTKKDERITVRMLEYDIHIALVHTLKKDSSNDYELPLPKSAVIFLGCDRNMAAYQVCKLIFAEGRTITYKIPIIKVQDYSLEEIEKKHLCILIPYALLRFKPRLHSKSHPLTKKELTDFVQHIIVILENEKKNNNITQLQFINYMQYIRMALEQIFSCRPELLEEVLNMHYPMIIPSFDEQVRMLAERESEIAAMDSAIAAMDSEIAAKDSAIAAKDSAIAIKDATIAKWQEWARKKGYGEEEFPQ